MLTLQYVKTELSYDVDLDFHIVDLNRKNKLIQSFQMAHSNTMILDIEVFIGA